MSLKDKMRQMLSNQKRHDKAYSSFDSQSPNRTPNSPKKKIEIQSPNRTPNLSKKKEESQVAHRTPKLSKKKIETQSPNRTPNLSKNKVESQAEHRTPKLLRKKIETQPSKTSNLLEKKVDSQVWAITPKLLRKKIVTQSPNRTPKLSKKKSETQSPNRTPNSSKKKVPQIVIDCLEGASDSNPSNCIVSRDPNLQILSNVILDILLENILFGYKTFYQRDDFWLLHDKIYQLLDESKVLKFLVPAFPVKSSNKDHKVLGINVDFGESIAIDILLRVARKIEAVYDAGIKIIILSDYHTFDQYIQVDEESYKIYHQGMKELIQEKGADDVIELINLSYFEQFENIPERKISTTLAENFGGNRFRESFHETVKTSPVLLRKYTQQKKFFKRDLSHHLIRSTNSKSKRFLKEVATGMLAQGVALDTFLNQQNCIKNYIRLSIHNHHPEVGKFAINLFKNKCRLAGDVQLRTPWHNVVILDTSTGHFFVKFKEEVTKNKDNTTVNVLVYRKEKEYFYLKLYLTKKAPKEPLDIYVSMIKPSCGIIVKIAKSKEMSVDIFTKETIKTLTKEFGTVIFRGFKEFNNEVDFLYYFEKHLQFKPLNWLFGPIHKVMPDKDMPGYVNSSEGIPVHWDMVAPPKYMGVDQNFHRYKDYICPVFALYCRSINRDEIDGCVEGRKDQQIKDEGATTFIDSVAAVQSLHGRTIDEWRQVHLQYETHLDKDDETNKKVYFGGKENTYIYPLIYQCPERPNIEVLRWWQNWPKDEFPNAPQHNSYKIESCPDTMSDISSKELEREIRQVAFDDRFFFSHQYETGDLVFVNNYTMLHGRNAFNHTQRELWRIQALPDSENIPRYFKDI